MTLRIMTAVCGLAAGAAMGQNALDRNLQVGSGGRNAPGRDIKQELQFRNAIVTGNAPGGMSFRADVGYRAPGEFFGHLGSNDTFTFRRDSAYSGLGGVGLRGTDALQYQFAVTTGNSPPPSLSGVPVFGRSGRAEMAGDAASLPSARREGFIEMSRPKAGEIGFDSRGLELMAVRSPSAFVANRGLAPSVMGRLEDKEGFKSVSASMLRGVAFDDIQVLATKKEEEKKPESPLALPGSTIPGAAEPAGLNNAAAPATTNNEYDLLLDRMRKAAPEPKAEEKPPEPRPGEVRLPDWQKRLEELRGTLRDERTGTAKAKPKATKPEEKPAGDPKPEEPKGDAKKSPAFEEGTIGMIRSGGGRIALLAPESFDAYGTQMKAGQEHLKAGRYFDAEERFMAALSAKPTDPMASIGRIHSQLGAGMFLSAAINLRELLVEHPELIGTRYDAALLPGKERVGRMMERLGELAAQPQGRDSALLMAYMGYQTGDTAAMLKGLDIVQAGAEDDQLSKLGTLLRKVWTTPEETPQK
jgi:hypothetical protein